MPNPYGGGGAYFKSDNASSWMVQGTYDQSFKTYVAASTSPPSNEPAPDTDAPETTIVKGAPNKSDKESVRFKFVSDEPGSTFECKLDKKPFKPCSSPKKVKVKDGKHKFLVRAIDAAGNPDPTADKDKFKIVD